MSGQFKERLSIEGLFNSLQTKKQAKRLNGHYAKLGYSDSRPVAIAEFAKGGGK